MDIMKVRSSLSICDCIFHFELNIIMSPHCLELGDKLNECEQMAS